MKINITTKKAEIENEDFHIIHPEDISKIENSSCTNIRVSNVLDEYINRFELLSEIKKKLRYDGIITITGLDILLFANSIIFGQTTMDEIRKQISVLNSVSNSIETLNFLQKIGLVIVSHKYDGCTYFIEARRKCPDE